MKIAFCGDSYCNNIRKVSQPNKSYFPYPHLVAKEFNAKILCNGLSGVALFHAYETMMENIEEADYIIFCVTEPYRFANRYRIPVGIDAVELYNTLGDDFTGIGGTVRKKTLAKIKIAMKIYYEEIISHRYHVITQRGLLREIDAVIKEYNKKCIFFKCFNSTFCDYTFENAVWGNSTLFDISVAEEKYMTKKEIKSIANFTDWRLNHMNEQNNRNMANFIIDVIKQDDFTSREIDMRGYFK
jgi:hypothetical protein